MIFILVSLLSLFVYVSLFKEPKGDVKEPSLVENDVKPVIDNYELIDPDEIDDEDAFAIGFGTGPGLYGSGRYTSEMLG